MLCGIRKWSLLEAIAWTIEMCEAQRNTDMEHGLAEITRELAVLAAQQCAAGDG